MRAGPPAADWVRSPDAGQAWAGRRERSAALAQCDGPAVAPLSAAPVAPRVPPAAARLARGPMSAIAAWPVDPPAVPDAAAARFREPGTIPAAEVARSSRLRLRAKQPAEAASLPREWLDDPA